MLTSVILKNELLEILVNSKNWRKTMAEYVNNAHLRDLIVEYNLTNLDDDRKMAR